MRPQLLHRQLYLAGIQVADQQFRPRRRQMLGQRIADLPEPLDRHAQSFQVVAAKPSQGRRADSGEHAQSRMRRWIAAAGGAGDVLGVLGDAVHVGARRAAVHRGDIGALQRLDDATERLEQGAAVIHMRRADDHRLAAALTQPRQRRLVAHALGEADGVLQGSFLVRIRQIAAPSQRRAKAGAVDGNDGLEPGYRVLGDVQ
ncbi:hypothetical protein D3C80_1483880 [compost metagenome]